MKASVRNFIEDKKSGCCCWRDCWADGVHLAPKSPGNLKDKYNFCLEHVRLYNKSWNFFDGMRQSDIETFQKESVSGHRPTSRMGVDPRYRDPDEIKKKVFQEFKWGGTQSNQKAGVEIQNTERESLSVLGLKYPVTMKEIKKKYKQLAKKYHPDLNGGEGDDKLKAINQAYSYLKSCGHFS